MISVIQLHCTPGPMPKTPEWDRARLYDPTSPHPVRIGASEGASVCGVGYDQPLAVYLYKRGELAKEFDEDTEARMRIGLLMEPVILTEYQQRKTMELGSCQVLPGQPMYFSIEWPWMSATPDALAMDVEGDTWGVECKNSSEYMHDRHGTKEGLYGVDGTDQVPLPYVFQAQHQMAVLGLSRVEFPVLLGGNRLHVYKVHRDEDLIRTIVEATRDMAERIVAGNPPEPNYAAPDVKRCLRAGIVDGKTVDLPEDAADWWKKYREAGQAIKDAEKVKDEMSARLLKAVGDAEFAHVGGTRLKRVVVGPTSYVTTVSRAGYSFMKESK